MALYNPTNGRFIRVHGNKIDAEGGVFMAARFLTKSKLPAGWDFEKFTVLRIMHDEH